MKIPFLITHYAGKIRPFATFVLNHKKICRARYVARTTAFWHKRQDEASVGLLIDEGFRKWQIHKSWELRVEIFIVFSMSDFPLIDFFNLNS